jgi:hypothetical protein
MYIVRNKKTKEIIHVNPAPLSQQLKGKDVYYQFDGRTMEIGRIDAHELPAHYTINRKGEIVEPSLQELVAHGIVKLAPDQKIVGNEIVPKTISEKVASGLIKLPPTYKIVGKGPDEVLVEKTLSEQVAEGLISLSPLQRVEGEGADERIVTQPAPAVNTDQGDEESPQYYPAP